MHEYKAVLLGDGGVGKTAIIHRLSSGSFEPELSPTVGGSFTPVVLATPHGEVEFKVWDTAGQEKFRDLVPLYFRNAHAALVVFDLTARASFESVDEWIATLRAVSPECFVAVVGNKCDLAAARAVPEGEGDALAQRCGAAFYTETSAFSGEGLEPLLPRLLELLLSRARPVVDETRVALAARPDAGARACC
jgi:small GTP-binding protein